VIAENRVDAPDVLILFAMVPSTPAYRVLYEGISQKIDSAFGDNCNIYVEYLEAERYPKGKYPREKFGIYNQKYKQAGLDLLICVGFDIVSVIRNNADSFLLRLPAISIDYDFSAYGIYSEIALNSRTYAVPVKYRIDSTLSTALKVFPDTRNIYCIGGVSALDQVLMAVSQKSIEKIPHKPVVHFLQNLSMDSVLRYVKHLPEKSIIMFSSFYADNIGVTYYNPEAIRLISHATNAPVFIYSDMGFGEGAFGGYLMCFSKVARIAGIAAVKILKGAGPETLGDPEKELYVRGFDWSQMQRWKIRKGDLPQGSLVFFKEQGVFEKFSWIIIPGIGFLFFQTLMIITLVILFRRQKKMSSIIKSAQARFNELLREDRILKIGQLTASLSHELNQPLTAILSTAQAGIRFIDSGKYTPELLKEILQNIADSDKRTAAILSSIRGMMKLEKREKERTEINSLISEIVDILQGKSAETGYRFILRLCDNPVYILADRVQIQQVILNILINAMEAMDGADSQDKTITISELCKDDEVVVSVQDSGKGISETQFPGLFKTFVSSKREGMGIGLALSRSIIEDHGGMIWARNLPGTGAEFSFKLKVIHDAP